ncbi:aldo/keto reductase [Hyphococcus sp.]|uniref:aldo/keto reductase n=1 Tax=Hyphococcus sp. TaxID=2038636 RepID=UPI003CCBF0B6
MKTRKIGQFEVAEIGLGCMNLSHAYGVPPAPEDAIKVLHRAVDLGVTHFDSAALYGFGKNEALVGPALKSVRNKIHLSSKCGMTGVDGKRVIDGRPETLRKTIDESLQRLQTDTIDLYYLHRYDKLNEIPIEESVGELARMVEAGKVRDIGLSEVSAETIRNAHGEHPIAAVQSEYSLWSRNVEIGALDAAKEIGAAFIAFSPLARGFLTSADIIPEDFAEKDIRRAMPRFNEPHFSENQKLLPEYRRLAKEADCTPSQLALAWLLQQSEHIIPIPGTTSQVHLEENIGASHVVLSKDVVARLDELLNEKTVSGGRYPPGTQKEIDTEEF